MANALLLLLSVTLLFSCQEEKTTIALDGNPKSINFFENVEKRVSGTSSEDISEISLSMSGYEDETIFPKNGTFSVDLVFRDGVEQGTMEFEGKSGDQVLSVVKTNFDVRKKVQLPTSEMFSFNLPAPTTSQLNKKATMWATNYFLPLVSNVSGGIPMRNMKNEPLGPVISRRDWCNSAMEGSVLINNRDGSQTTYNYAGTTSSFQVDCSSVFNHKPSHKVKFKVANGIYGDGVRNYKLVPFRSIAVDPNYYPYGSVIYIPAAKGHRIVLPDGSKAIHDGYFFAADAGGLIKTNHIDVYTGVTKSTFSFVKSSASRTFTSYIISDPGIKDWLLSIHR